MSVERNWFVRLNLDELADELDALDSTEEHGQWLKGFRVGSRGHGPRDTWEDSRLRGHVFGVKCFEAAEAFREKQSEKGRKSAEAKRTKSQPEVNHGSTTDQPRLEPDWQPEANQPVTSNQKPVTKSEKRSTKFSTEAEEIYSLYPRKEARADAIKAIEKALRKTSAEVLADAVRAFGEAVKGQEVRFIPHPATWFNGERWTDDRTTWTAWKANNQPPPASNLPEWKREKIAQLEREARRFESGGMGQSAKMIRREIADLMGGDNA